AGVRVLDARGGAHAALVWDADRVASGRRVVFAMVVTLDVAAAGCNADAEEAEVLVELVMVESVDCAGLIEEVVKEDLHQRGAGRGSCRGGRSWSTGRPAAAPRSRWCPGPPG